MHELSITQALIKQVQREVEQSGQDGRIVRIELVVGRLAGVSCDSIRFAFGLLSADSPLERTELHITEPKATCRCHTCGARVEIDEVAVACLECGGTDVTVHGGRELLLESIEIED